MPFIFDAQSIVTRHFADFVRAHTILSRSIPQSGKFFRRNGNHHARPALAEERILRGDVFRHRHTRSEPCGCKARFRQRHRHARRRSRRAPIAGPRTPPGSPDNRSPISPRQVRSPVAPRPRCRQSSWNIRCEENSRCFPARGGAWCAAFEEVDPSSSTITSPSFRNATFKTLMHRPGSPTSQSPASDKSISSASRYRS